MSIFIAAKRIAKKMKKKRNNNKLLASLLSMATKYNAPLEICKHILLIF